MWSAIVQKAWVLPKPFKVRANRYSSKWLDRFHPTQLRALLMVGGNDDSMDLLQHGWASQPNNRGTLDILWSCLFTVFLCTWVMLFLNLPRLQENVFVVTLRLGIFRDRIQFGATRIGPHPCRSRRANIRNMVSFDDQMNNFNLET